MSLWYGLLDALGQVLRMLHDATTGLFGDHAWMAAIVLLTLLVRLALMPLAIRQFRSMQAMQTLRPEMQKIQKKYKTDRGMMRTDPEKYRERRQKQQEELMALYKEHNVNPAASCLPLLAQMPVFVALFSVLRSPDVIPELTSAPFVGGSTLQQNISTMLENDIVIGAVVAIIMLVGMGITTFVQQRQTMARQAVSADDTQAQQQKMMMYIMPVFLVFLGWGLPVGILVYWVTTNALQVGQQWYMLRETSAAAAGGPGGGPSATTRSPRRAPDADAAGSNGSKRNGSKSNGHRPGGPGRMGQKRDETRDKRR